MYMRLTIPHSIRYYLNTIFLITVIFGLFFCSLAIADNGNFIWAGSFNGTDNGGGTSIVTDSSGNTYISGSFSGTIDSDPSTTGVHNLTSNGENDCFVSKLDANRNFIWSKKFGGIKSDQCNDVIVDTSGNLYITGYFSETVDFDPSTAGVYELTSNGHPDVFITKLDKNGSFVWAKAFGGTDWDHCEGIVVDDYGNVFALGLFYGSVDFDPSVAGDHILTSNGQRDIFISKLDMNGLFVWAKRIGGTHIDYGTSITIDDKANIYITGYFQNTVDFDPSDAGIFNLTSEGESDIFISKLDANGTFAWAKRIGGTSFDGGNSITIDENENVYTTGEFRGTVDFDPSDDGIHNLTNDSTSDCFIIKLDNSGKFIWAKSYVGESSGKQVVIDNLNRVYTVGEFRGTVDFDPNSLGVYNLTSKGQTDGFICKLTNSGDFIWTKSFGGESLDSVYSIFVDDSRNVYTTGIFKGSVDFDPSETGSFYLTTDASHINSPFISKLGSLDGFQWPIFLPAILGSNQ